MGHFDRPGKLRQLPETPERLQRLDRELKIEKTKTFDYLFAVRNDRFGQNYRIRVCIARIRDAQPGDYEFVATCTIGARVHRVHHFLPSGAFAKLTDQIRWAIAKLSFERNMSKAAASVTG